MNRNSVRLVMGKEYFKTEQELDEFIKDNEKILSEFEIILSNHKSKYEIYHVVTNILRDVMDILEVKEGESVRDVAKLRMKQLKESQCQQK